jgi:hypothetical protein
MQAKERRPIPEIRFAQVPEQKQLVSGGDSHRFSVSRNSLCVLFSFWRAEGPYKARRNMRRGMITAP